MFAVAKGLSKYWKQSFIDFYGDQPYMERRFFRQQTIDECSCKYSCPCSRVKNINVVIFRNAGEFCEELSYGYWSEKLTKLYSSGVLMFRLRAFPACFGLSKKFHRHQRSGED